MSPGGRPQVGKPINVRLGDDLLAQVDAYAERQDIKRAEAVRQLLTMGDMHRDIAVATSDHCYEIRRLHAAMGSHCRECQRIYPCPTVQILDRRLT